MAQGLGVLTVLAEDMNSVPSPTLGASHCLELQLRESNAFLWLPGHTDKHMSNLKSLLRNTCVVLPKNLPFRIL